MAWWARLLHVAWWARRECYPIVTLLYLNDDSVIAEAEVDQTDGSITTEVASGDECDSETWDGSYQREIIDGVTVYFGGDLYDSDDSDDSDWEDPEDADRREYVEQYNFDLLEGMKPMVFVPSSVQSRADRRNSCGAYLYDGNDNRVYDDASIVDRKHET